jgi:hypothetical protein
VLIPLERPPRALQPQAFMTTAEGGFDQDKSESLRDGVQVEESSGSGEQFVFALHADRSDVWDSSV